jgi:hypothetical protein
MGVSNTKKASLLMDSLDDLAAHVITLVRDCPRAVRVIKFMAFQTQLSPSSELALVCSDAQSCAGC